MPINAETQLREQHQEISRLARQIRDIVRRSTSEFSGEIAPIRIALAALLMRHFADEQELLIGRLTGTIRAKVPRLAEVRDRTQALRFAYSAHVRDWNAKAIDENAAGYATSLDKLMQELENQIVFEEQHLFDPGFAALAIKSGARSGRQR